MITFKLVAEHQGVESAATLGEVSLEGAGQDGASDTIAERLCEEVESGVVHAMLKGLAQGLAARIAIEGDDDDD